MRLKSFPKILLLSAIVFSLPLAAARADVGVHGGERSLSFLDHIQEFFQESVLNDIRVQMLKETGLLVSPYFKSAFEYTNNVFRAPNPRQDATIWRFTPGVNISHVGDYGQAGVGYEATFNYFTKYGDQNEQDQKFSAYADLVLAKGVTLRLTEDLIQQGSTAGAPGVEPTNFVDNTTTAALILDWEEEGVAEIGYQFFNREFAGDLSDAFSYNDNTFYGRYTRPLKENMKGYVGYDLHLINYESTSRDAVAHELPIGVEGLFGDTGIFYRGEVGVYIRNQEPTARNDYWTFTGSVSLQKQITKKTAAEVGFTRRPVEASFALTTVYDEKMFYGNLSHAIAKNFRGRADVYYANRDYEDSVTLGAITQKRSDDAVGVGVGFDYAARRWLVFNVDYRFERKDSNFSNFDSTENRLILGMTIPV